MTISATLLTLVGGRPVVQFSAENGEIRNKLSILGIIFAGLHAALGVYCDKKTNADLHANPEAFVEENNIMRATDAMSRIVALIQQPILAVTCYLQSKALHRFLVSLEEFDDYLIGNRVQVTLIARRMRWIDFAITVIVFITGIVNIVIVILLYGYYYEQPIYSYDVYNVVMPVLNYLVQMSVTFFWLYATSLRMGSFYGIVKQLHVLCCREQNHPENIRRKYQF